MANRYCLPTLLDRDVDYKLDIFTDRPGDFPDHKVTEIQGKEGPDKQRVVSQCHGESLRWGEPTVICCPDLIYGSGTLKRLAKAAEDRIRMLVVPAMRLERPKIIERLRIGMSPRELTVAALECLHPNASCMYWDEPLFTGTPAQIYWKTEHGVVVRGFHMHPLLMWLTDADRFKGTTDDDAVNLIPAGKTRVITDSDEIACFEMSHTSYQWQKEAAVGNHDIRQWVNRKTNKMHRWFFQHECHVHTGIKQSVALPKELARYA